MTDTPKPSHPAQEPHLMAREIRAIVQSAVVHSTYPSPHEAAFAWLDSMCAEPAAPPKDENLLTRVMIADAIADTPPAERGEGPVLLTAEDARLICHDVLDEGRDPCGLYPKLAAIASGAAVDRPANEGWKEGERVMIRSDKDGGMTYIGYLCSRKDSELWLAATPPPRDSGTGETK